MCYKAASSLPGAGQKHHVDNFSESRRTGCVLDTSAFNQCARRFGRFVWHVMGSSIGCITGSTEVVDPLPGTSGRQVAMGTAMTHSMTSHGSASRQGWDPCVMDMRCANQGGGGLVTTQVRRGAARQLPAGLLQLGGAGSATRPGERDRRTGPFRSRAGLSHYVALRLRQPSHRADGGGTPPNACPSPERSASARVAAGWQGDHLPRPRLAAAGGPCPRWRVCGCRSAQRLSQNARSRRLLQYVDAACKCGGYFKGHQRFTAAQYISRVPAHAPRYYGVPGQSRLHLRVARHTSLRHSHEDARGRAQTQ
eukprot:352193-Chlamydomonas_euryale.AAC.14